MEKFKAVVRLARPHQYIKNGFIWLPLFFGYHLADRQALISTLWAFLIFCMSASIVYIINDIQDIEDDRKHPVKKNRPLAKGMVTKSQAMAVVCLLAVFATAASCFLLPLRFLAVAAGYVVLNLAYSARLKHVAIIDIVCIAIGFVLRVKAGGISAGVVISPWIITMTFLIALFLGLAKRRDDLLLSVQGSNTRKSLDGYNLEFVSLAMGVMASVTTVSYILYTVSPEIVAKHGTHKLYLTTFWVIIGLLRYLQITFVDEKSGSPTMVLLKDRLLQAVIIFWLVNIYWLLYCI